MLMEIESEVYTLVRVWNYLESLSLPHPHDFFKKSFKYCISPGLFKNLQNVSELKIKLISK